MTDTSEPRIVQRSDIAYVGIVGSVTIQSVADIADRLPGVIRWLGERGIAPAQAPFFRYLTIDPAGTLEIEVGVPIAEPIEGEGDIRPGVLPAGRYVTRTHVGHPEALLGVTADMLDWAAERGLKWDMSESGGRETWGCRLEVYNTNPLEEPDATRWVTDLVFRLAD